MKTSLEVKLPSSLYSQVFDYQISPYHKLNELLVGVEDEKMYIIRSVAVEAMLYGLRRSNSQWSIDLEGVKDNVVKLKHSTVFDEDVANRFAISYEAELHRLKPVERWFLASQDVSHQDIIRAIAKITYENLWRDSFTFKASP